MELVRPLLAATATDADLQRIRYPKLMSPKIDGVRAVCRGGRLLSRSMKLIPNLYCQMLYGKREYEGLDGELVVGSPTDPHLCDKTRSGVMSQLGRPLVTWHVFDKWDVPAPFEDRFTSALSVVENAPNIVIVPHDEVESYEHLLEVESSYLKLGYEGGILRDPRGKYKQNRSTLREEILIKVKRFTDAEAIIEDFVPLLRNLNARVLDERGLSKRSDHRENKVEDDTLGALVCRDLETGVRFNIGSGFTQSDRDRIWNNRSRLKSKMVRYKKFLYGEKDKPRQGIFICFRDPRDL